MNDKMSCFNRVLCTVFCMVFFVSSALPPSVTSYAAGKIKVTLAGKPVKMSIAPRKTGGTYLVPVKDFAKALKVTYHYSAKTKRVTLKKGTRTIICTMGKKTAKVNGKTVYMKAKAKRIAKKPMADSIFIAKQYGYPKYSYNSKTKTLNFAKPKKTIATVIPTNTSSPTPTADPVPSTPGLTSPVSTGLPMISINIESGKEVADKETKLDAKIVFADPDGNGSSRQYDIKIQGRGNSTFEAPKKPYKFSFSDKSKQSIYGMPAENKWVLLANYYDKTLIRNAVVYHFAAHLSGLDFTPRFVLTELTVNGRYDGVYMLTEQIETGKTRVDIDTSGDHPGFLLEWDMRAAMEGTEGIDYFAVPHLGADPKNELYKNGITFAYKSADGQKAAQSQRDYIKNTVIQASDAIVYPYDGRYLDLIDMKSFVDYYIVDDLMGNNDHVNFSSIFLYQDQGGKLKLGPVWDYDLALGDSGVNPGQPMMEWGNPWFNPLFTKSYTFRNALAERFKALKPVIEKEIFEYIDQLQVQMQAAQKRNFERWDIMDERLFGSEKRNPAGSYDGEIEYMKNWLKSKYAFLCAYY